MSDDTHDREVEWRWGETDAYKESARRVASYTDEDMARSKSESAAIVEMLAEKMAAGLASDHPEVMALAELHRQHISKWFYECTYEIQVGLSDMYVNDPRFTAFYDDTRPGLAAFLADAILANAVTAGASLERASLESLRTQMGVRAASALSDASSTTTSSETATSNEEMVVRRRGRAESKS